ncbi:MAG: tetratricopeptide repeat protein [Rhodothalassiaceae bacterium]
MGLRRIVVFTAWAFSLFSCVEVANAAPETFHLNNGLDFELPSLEPIFNEPWPLVSEPAKPSQVRDIRERLSSTHSLFRAVDMIESGRFESANNFILQAFAQQPELQQDGLALELRAMAEALTGQLEASVTTFDRAAELQPGSSAPLTKKGIALSAAGQFEQAAIAYEAALQRQPGDLLAQSRLGLLYTAFRDYDRAVPLLSAVLKTRAESTAVDIVAALGKIAVEQGRPDDAIALLAPRISPSLENARAQLTFGLALFLDGKLERALLHLEQAHAQAPEDFQAAFAVGRAYALARRFDEAAAAFSKAIAYRTDDPVPAIRELALVRLASSQFAEAEALFAKIAQEGNATPFDLARLGEVQVLRGNFQAAQDTYEQMCQRFPDSSESYQKLASFQASLRQYSKAEATLIAGLGRLGEDATLLRTLALLYGRQGAVSEAIAAADRWVTAAPDDAAALEMLGVLYEEDGNFSDAMESYRSALAKDPNRFNGFSGWFRWHKMWGVGLVRGRVFR